MTAAEPLFRRDGELLVPSGHARGPWDPGQLHGGAPAALVAGAVQALAPAMQVARLTCEFLGPVPLAPLAVAARIVKPGGRFQLAEAEITTAGRPVLLARAVLLRRGEPLALPAGATTPDGVPGDGPEGPWVGPSQFAGAPEEGFVQTGMEIRFVDGTDFGRGPGRAWFRFAHPLVGGDGEPAPVARAAAAADFGNGIARVLDFADHLFVNTDLTVALLRDPESAWIGVDAVTRIEPHGIGRAWSTLYDERGAIGAAQQTLFVTPRAT